MKRFKEDVKKLYEIKIHNVIGVCLTCLGIFLIIKYFVFFFGEVLNIHLGLKFACNDSGVGIYSGFLALILPVAILIIERIEDRDNAIISETYLKETSVFPIAVYFTFNLLIFTKEVNQYHFIITSIISTIMIIYMYYKAFKMISNLIYEKGKINVVQKEIILGDLSDQTRHFSDKNLISHYKKYGIINRYDYIPTKGLKKYPIYPEKDYLIIEQYNYKLLNKIIKKLREINGEYIISMETNNSKKELKNSKKLNIIIWLSDIGTASDRNVSWITIYYKDGYEGSAKEIAKLLNNKLYETSEKNNHVYIEEAYNKILKECVESINSKSATLFTQSLNKYLDIYKNYINEIPNEIGQYTYEVSYNQVNSIYRIKAYDFLRNIQKNMYDYCEMIMKIGNSKLMNSLISFLYDMMLHSYDKRELLSIQHLYSTYTYLNECSLKLDDESSFNKIKVELFEFMNGLKYDYNDGEKGFVRDVLLVCNKTIGDIIFHLSLNDKDKCTKYIDKLIKYIYDIKDNMNQVDPSYSEQNNNYYSYLNDVYENFICNTFAISSYIVHNFEMEDVDTSQLLSCFNNFDYDELNDILIKTIHMEYNSRIYSWDWMDKHREEDEDGVYTIHTVDYIIHLYSLIIVKNKVRIGEVKGNYDLSLYADRIIDEMQKLNEPKYVNAFEILKEKVEEEEKEFIRNTPISFKKVEQFRDKFIEYYKEHNNLNKLFEKTKNLKVLNNQKKGTNYLAINSIVDKTYFLESTPNNRCIIWTNFEAGYANSFIDSEEKKVASVLKRKAEYRDEKLTDYLSKLTKSQLRKTILFSNYTTFDNVVDRNYIEYNNPRNEGIDYASMFVKIKNVYIPVVVIDGLDDNYIIQTNTNSIGKLEKNIDGFTIEVNDFFTHKESLEKVMQEDIRGLELKGEEKRKHLLESVDLFIKEYIRYDDRSIVALKFDH